ncbi:uncharacterized protein LOC142892521 [Nelusetta ayraudi]|uniref:uncharacterized protein LOC142892521 n=1 Tax=Nelusetta ayraudi TaxID=303726 RepID=UPI003F71DAE7
MTTSQQMPMDEAAVQAVAPVAQSIKNNLTASQGSDNNEEKGKLHELRGKNLDNIGSDNDEDEVEDDDESDSSEDEQSTDGKTLEAVACSEDDEVVPGLSRSREMADFTVEGMVENKIDRKKSVQSTKSIEQRRSGRTKRNCCPNRTPWTTKEVNAVMRHFSDHIKKGKLTSKRECEICKTSESALKERTIQNVRDFVRNKGLTQKLL